MMSSDGFKNIIRVGLFKEFDYNSQTALVQMFDRSTGNILERCDMPLGSFGIYSYPKKNTKVLISYGYRERPYIVSFLTTAALAGDFSSSANTKNVSTTDVQYPVLAAGEVVIQGLKNSQLFFEKSGHVSLFFGDSYIKFGSNDIYTEKVSDHYVSTEAGRWSSGIIKRDLRKVVGQTNYTLDKISSLKYEDALSEIGKNPLYRTSVVTNNLGASNEIMRNPALVEEKHITYEFANSYMVGNSDQERDRVFKNTDDKSFLSQPNRRDQSRTDVLNLNDVFANNLIEEVRGTIVDRYGNILDLNRNIIQYNESIVPKKDNNKRPDLEELFLRRAIKYHFELNARKDKAAGKPNYTSDSGPDVKNGHVHSRWFMDIDGEGLTKINIPASSNSGNIPVLSRYLNTSIENSNAEALNDSFRDQSNSPPKDVTHLPFGSNAGIIANTDYLPPKISKVVTAYHDITSTAKDIISPIMEASISNKPGSQNAGGKSVHANLDGSMELNVGRDFIDHKSVIIDTSGSIISRIGKDKKNNSIVSQVDGNISIQVGGDTISNGTSPETPNEDNTVKIFIKTVNGNFDKIEITKDAIVIESAPNKNIVFKSGNNLVLDATGKTFIGGEAIQFFGSASRDGKSVSGERLLVRNGLEIK